MGRVRGHSRSASGWRLLFCMSIQGSIAKALAGPPRRFIARCGCGLWGGGNAPLRPHPRVSRIPSQATSYWRKRYMQYRALKWGFLPNGPCALQKGEFGYLSKSGGAKAALRNGVSRPEVTLELRSTVVRRITSHSNGHIWPSQRLLTQSQCRSAASPSASQAGSPPKYCRSIPCYTAEIWGRSFVRPPFRVK